jgi:hypothetical protein
MNVDQMRQNNNKYHDELQIKAKIIVLTALRLINIVMLIFAYDLLLFLGCMLDVSLIRLGMRYEEGLGFYMAWAHLAEILTVNDTAQIIVIIIVLGCVYCITYTSKENAETDLKKQCFVLIALCIIIYSEYVPYRIFMIEHCRRGDRETVINWGILHSGKYKTRKFDTFYYCGTNWMPAYDEEKYMKN